MENKLLSQNDIDRLLNVSNKQDVKSLLLKFDEEVVRYNGSNLPGILEMTSVNHQYGTSNYLKYKNEVPENIIPTDNTVFSTEITHRINNETGEDNILIWTLNKKNEPINKADEDVKHFIVKEYEDFIMAKLYIAFDMIEEHRSELKLKKVTIDDKRYEDRMNQLEEEKRDEEEKRKIAKKFLDSMKGK